MKIYVLTGLGRNMAASPVASPNNAQRILYFMRRNQGRASDVQISDQLGVKGMDLRMAMNALLRQKAVDCVVSA